MAELDPAVPALFVGKALHDVGQDGGARAGVPAERPG
ncbi:MAG: hypothetical protein JWO38_8268, partial [Gemmataceae bacterium]|nr:hypothetical protein [Gemmataceae bacterium]